MAPGEHIGETKMDPQPDILEDLSAYLDGELDPAAAGRVEQAACERADVADALRRLSRTRQLLRAVPRERLRDSLVDRVLDEAAARGLVPRRRRLPALLAAAAGLALAAGAGLLAYSAWWAPRPEASGPAAIAQAPGSGAATGAGRVETPPVETLALNPPAKFGKHAAGRATKSAGGFGPVAGEARDEYQAERQLFARIGARAGGAGGGEVRRVTLTVANLPAARREVEAILAAAAASATNGNYRGRAAKGPGANRSAGEAGAAWHVGRVAENVLCYYVAAEPQQLERIAHSLGRLRTVEAAEGRARQEFALADAVLAGTQPVAGAPASPTARATRPARPAGAPAAPKPPRPAPAPAPAERLAGQAVRSQGDAAPYHAARLRRFLSPSQKAATAPAAKQALRPRLLLIELRAAPPAADLDPGRNIR